MGLSFPCTVLSYSRAVSDTSSTPVLTVEAEKCETVTYVPFGFRAERTPCASSSMSTALIACILHCDLQLEHEYSMTGPVSS